ncbi:MAG: hypothetical protein NTY07_11255 [Bacteroidia bacterium]|nr:hypothetical protein [Bacteroidia bacterium]
MKTSKYHNLVRINLLTWIITAITLGLSLQSNAQLENKNTLLQMIEEDRTTIDAIAGYDQKIQNHILQVVQTPEVLKKVEELQKRSQNQFRAIINDYDRDAQAAFYEMARYPNLITDLVSNGKPSSAEVAQIVSNYPEDIHATTNNYARTYFDVLLRIDQLNNEIDRAFQAYLEPYNTETRESVNALLAYPEIVSVLVEDKDFTSLLGTVYSEDPEWVVRNLERISQELAEQNKEDLNAYKNQIENDPEAYNEMLAASERFARENNETRYLDGSSDPIVEVNLINSYPYWFGYPYWYSDPYWRPRPFYYHTGFYRNHFGNIVFVGLPSYHFMHWQTYYHPSLFPHLSYNYYSYYENHFMNRYRNSQRSVPRNGFYRSIEANVINNPRVNNSNLERIDHQRGNNIVRRPNAMESGANRSGTVNRRGNENLYRNGNAQRSSGTTGGVVNRRGTEQNNSGSAENSVNRRAYNTINPGRSEGSYNRRGSETGSGTIRRRATPTITTPEGTPTGRSRKGTFANPGNNENPRSNDANVNRIKENVPASTTRRQTSSAPVVNRAAEQQQSAVQQERSKTSAPAVRAERSNSQPARSSASGRREVNSVNVQPSRREQRREAKAASRQSGSRNPGRGN